MCSPALLDDFFGFVDDNLGGSTKYLRELCEALIPLKKHWGCALTFNILKDESLVKLMARAGCRYIRAFSNGIVLSFGLLVGADGDTNEYLEKPITFLGIVCPYPETPFSRQLQAEGRLLPGTLSRDYDGYTLLRARRKPIIASLSPVASTYGEPGGMRP